MKFCSSLNGQAPAPDGTEVRASAKIQPRLIGVFVPFGLGVATGATLVQKIRRFANRQRGADIQHHNQTGDSRRCVEASMQAAFCPMKDLPAHPARRESFSSDSAKDIALSLAVGRQHPKKYLQKVDASLQHKRSVQNSTK